MAFDFPASPTVGQIFTDPPTGVTYEWDGQAWMRKQDAAPVTLIPRKETAMSDPSRPTNLSLLYHPRREPLERSCPCS